MLRFSTRALRNATRGGTGFAGYAAGRSFCAAPQAPAQKSGSSPLLMLLLVAGGAGAGYVAGQNNCCAKTCDKICPKSKFDEKAVRSDIADLIADNDAGPVFVRLAWHAAGTYDKATKTGGSVGGTIRFSPEKDHGANAGLDKAMAMLEPIKSKHPNITYADLYTLAGAVAIEEAGGPQISWRAGRSDDVDGKNCTPDGRLPDADKAQDHVRQVFYRMGFNDREIVALIGAHTLGRCHTDRSGYDGPWTYSPLTFSNLFYQELLKDQWQEKKWSGPKQFVNKSGEIMMLPADMAFKTDPVFRKYVEVFAEDEELFFKEFSAAFSKLLELGCSFK